MRIFCGGAGILAQKILKKCTSLDTYEILGVIDNDPRKIGKRFLGNEIFPPSILEKIIPDKIVVLTDAFQEIKEQIVKDYPHYKYIVESKCFFYRESLLNRYARSTDPEICEVLEYIKKNDLDVFNYPFVKKYQNMEVDVFFDEIYQMYYTLHYGKRMYFPKKFDNKEMIVNYYKYILMEQDAESPHRYLDSSFCIHEGDVVIDAGVAEGNFSLDNIEKISKLYLIESDVNWIEALKITFKDYMDKVTIIHAFVSSYDQGLYSRIDSIVSETEVNFIKMDIEGNEWDGLQGAKEIIENSKKLRLAICSYHSDFDQSLIEAWMDAEKIKHSTTKGYMWYPWVIRQNYVSNKLNRAIVRGIKEI